MKKLIFKIIFTYTVFITKIFSVHAVCIELLWLWCGWWSWWGGTAPSVVCNGLPWCGGTVGWKSFFNFIWNMIAEWIKYVAVISVISLIIAGMMYLTSGWEEEHTKKAKKWIIWALVWVVISTSAWAIINLANSFKIN